MRTRNILFAAFVAAIGMVACESILPEQQHPIDEPKTFTVQLGMSGEINVSQNPLTRFTPDDRDLYGIQVYHKPASEVNYQRYAYGLFDNIEDVQLEVTENHNYKFEVMLIDDGKDKIFRDSILVDNIPYIGYGEPFYAYNKYNGASSSSITIVSNEFTYGEDRYFWGDGGSEGLDNVKYKTLDGTKCLNAEDINAFYGELKGYTPTDEGSTIDIYLKHMIYGLRVEVGEFLNNGTLTVKLDSKSSSNNDYHNYTITPENRTLETIYAYSGTSGWYNKTDVTNATTTRYIDFTWTKDDGTTVEWQKQLIEFTRLKETVVTLDYYEDESAGSNNISMHYDDTEMESNYTNYTFGDTQDEYDW